MRRCFRSNLDKRIRATRLLSVGLSDCGRAMRLRVNQDRLLGFLFARWALEVRRSSCAFDGVPCSGGVN